MDTDGKQKNKTIPNNNQKKIDKKTRDRKPKPDIVTPPANKEDGNQRCKLRTDHPVIKPSARGSRQAMLVALST